MTDICKYEAKTQKQKKIRQSLFGNYYSTLNYLSNGIQYFFFSFKIFPKKKLKLNEKIKKWIISRNVHYLKGNLMYNKSYQISFAWKLFVLEFYPTLL